FAAAPAESADWFSRALDLEPRHAVAGLNRAEALTRLGRTAEAIEQAKRTLAQVDEPAGLIEEVVDAPAYQIGFDFFRVAWERAGWRNAGMPEAECEAKRSLLRCWLHALLAELTGEINHYEAAEQGCPDLGIFKAALGCVLARNKRMAEARPLLHAAVSMNPF